MSRKFQCKEKIETEIQQNVLKSTSEGLKSTLEALKSTSGGSEKHLVDLKSNRCEYCLEQFANRKTLTRHYNNCKAQEDPVRQLEIQHGVVPVLPDNPLECTFNKTLSRKTILQKHFSTCKKKREYHQTLKKPKQTDASGNTYNINNGTINNIFINGQEENKLATIVQELKNIN